MNYLKMGNKIIYYIGNSQFAMTENDRNYILEGKKWLDENTYKYYWLANLTDRIMMEELEEK